MLYADAIRRQVEDAPRAALPAVTSALWKAFADGHVTEAEAEALSALIELRQVSSAPAERSPAPTLPSLEATLAGHDALQERQNRPRTGFGSRPRSDASLERRRRWAASGRLPPALAARFTLAEQAALALVAAETTRKGDCRLSVPHLAAVAGVAETTVRNAIREARKLGLLTVEERRATGFRSDTNVVRIVSPEWTAWLRLARRGTSPVSERHGTPMSGGGCKSPNRTPTHLQTKGKTGTAGAPQGRKAQPDSTARQSSRVACA